MEEKDMSTSDIGESTSFRQRLENFWYHYKIHTIALICVIFIFSIVMLQTCSKVSFDGYILYAGPHELKQNAGGSYVTAVSSLKRVCGDYDNDGATNVALLNLFVINNEEADELLTKNPGMEINSSLVTEDSETLHQSLLYGDYYVCFLSERIFLEYEERYEGKLFVEVSEYLSDGVEYSLATKRGVYLSSLPFYSLPEIENLPEDTVVCLRRLSEVSSVFGKSENAKNFSRGEQIFKNILSYK